MPNAQHSYNVGQSALTSCRQPRATERTPFSRMTIELRF